MRKWLVKDSEASYVATYPGSRSLEDHIKKGLIILDKPQGPSCNIVDTWVKEIIGINKCSHGGTLDPKVSGVLVIALEESTKLMPILLTSKKEYIALGYLHKIVPEKEVRKACEDIIGKIKQIPPKRSAVARREREREIYYLEVIEIRGQYLLIKVGCQAGTYIRRLFEQIGQKVGVGAQMVELRRTKSGMFTEKDCVTLQDLSDAIASEDENKLREIIKPLEIIGNNIGCVIVDDGAIDRLRSGSPLFVGGVIRVTDDINIGDIVGMFSLAGEMIGFGKAAMSSKEMIEKSKGAAVMTDRILSIRK